jgi:thioredoxin-related protein
MLFGKTVAVYCENHTEHTDTVRTSQETHYISATETNRLMLFEEAVGVYCEDHTEDTDTVRTSQKNTLCLRYRDQPVNAVWGNSRCLL